MKKNIILCIFALMFLSGCSSEKVNLLTPRNVVDNYEGENFCFYLYNLKAFADEMDIVIGDGGEFIREVEENGKTIRRYRQAPDLESPKYKERYNYREGKIIKTLILIQRDISKAMGEDPLTKTTYDSFWENYYKFKTEIPYARNNKEYYRLDANLASLYDALLLLPTINNLKEYSLSSTPIDTQREKTIVEKLENYAQTYPECVTSREIANVERSKHKKVALNTVQKESMNLNAPLIKENENRIRDSIKNSNKRLEQMTKNVKILFTPSYKF